jgi:hypothetical protein
VTIDLSRDEIWFLKALRAAGARGRIVCANLSCRARSLSGSAVRNRTSAERAEDAVHHY